MRRLTVHSLLGLGVGLVLGIAIQRTGPAWGPSVLGVADVVVRAWTNAFRLLALPLVTAQLFVAITAGPADRTRLGRVGAVTPVVFAGLLVGAALLSWIATQWLMRLPSLASLSLVPAHTPPPPLASPSEGPAWVDDLVPTSLVTTLGGSNILAAMLFTLAFALAARRLEPPALDTLRRGAKAVGDAMFILVEWLLVLTPGVIAALVARSAATSGFEVGRVMLWFSAVEIVVLLVVLVALYPASVLLGRVTPGRFARLLLPAQLTAATTRSSLATLPALLSAAAGLGRPDSAFPYVVPLAGAMLKLSRAVSGPVKLLFLAAVLGVPLTIDRILVFTVTIILLSPSTVGVPRVTSGSRSLPAYIAAGIPGEYVVLLSATTMVTDIFMTMLNTTGYFAAGVMVDRFAASGPAREPAPADSAPAEA